MFKLKNLLKGTINVMKNVSKKAYTTGYVIGSGCILTVLILGTNGFHNQTEDVQYQINRLTEENIEEDEEEEVVVTNKSHELALSYSAIIEKEAPPIVQISMMDELNENDDVLSMSQQVLEDSNGFLTEKDYMALVRIVEAEATGEDIIGKILVANVVINRVKSERFPNTIYDVIHQSDNGRYQFSPLGDGRYYSVTITDSTYEAIERALRGEDYSNNALFFVARSIASENAVSWFDTNLEKVLDYGVHEFYTY